MKTSKSDGGGGGVGVLGGLTQDSIHVGAKGAA